MIRINGIEPVEVYCVFKVEDIQNKMLKQINQKGELKLTHEHVCIEIDHEVGRAALCVFEDNFSEDQWEKVAYNLNEWYVTFDEILLEILELKPEDCKYINHWTFEKDGDYFIAVSHENK